VATEARSRRPVVMAAVFGAFAVFGLFFGVW
jgi:hypothetical protein